MDGTSMFIQLVLRLPSNKTALSARTGRIGSAHVQRLLRMRTSWPPDPRAQGSLIGRQPLMRTKKTFLFSF